MLVTLNSFHKSKSIPCQESPTDARFFRVAPDSLIQNITRHPEYRYSHVPEHSLCSSQATRSSQAIRLLEQHVGVVDVSVSIH
jgi:hypothetical protein